jgi:DNA-binding NarL/FixJ family response regulator
VLDSETATRRDGRRGKSLEPVRVLIADDSDAVRGGLRSLLSSRSGMHIVGEARDGDEALELCGSLRPQVVIMDVGMPVMDGLAASRAILGRWPGTRVLLFTLLDSHEQMQRAHEVGVSGYVLKGASRRELLAAIRRALSAPPAAPRRDTVVEHLPGLAAHEVVACPALAADASIVTAMHDA